MKRFFSTFFTTLPFLAWFGLMLVSLDSSYYWSTYLVAGLVMLSASFLLGLFGPANSWKRAGLWIFLQSSLAWFVGLLVLGLLNLTPLCVGQDNGDGSNDIFLCLLQSVLVAFFYTPLALFSFIPSVILGGWILKKSG